MTAATTAIRALAPLRASALPPRRQMPALLRRDDPGLEGQPAAPFLARWTGLAARFRDTPPSHLLTTAILAVLWSGVFLWRFA